MPRPNDMAFLHTCMFREDLSCEGCRTIETFERIAAWSPAQARGYGKQVGDAERAQVEEAIYGKR